MRKEHGLSTVSISIILAIFIVAAFVVFFVVGGTSNDAPKVHYETVSEAFDSGKDIKCTYVANGDSATYFFGGGNIRAEAESVGVGTYLILKPEGAIVWTNTQPPLTANASDTAAFRSRLLASPLSDYDCREVHFDYSVFTPPAE